MSMQVIRKSDNKEFKISPLIIESKLRSTLEKTSDDESSQIDSPCLKRQYSMTSTIDSPFSLSSKNYED